MSPRGIHPENPHHERDIIDRGDHPLVIAHSTPYVGVRNNPKDAGIAPYAAGIAAALLVMTGQRVGRSRRQRFRRHNLLRFGIFQKSCIVQS